jgi:hypothetical protein
VLISAAAIVRGDKKIRTSARSCVGATRAGCPAVLDLKLEKGTRQRFTVWAEGLDGAGDYRSSLALVSTETDHPSKRQVATVRFAVGDGPWAPLAVVCAGVVCAWLVAFLSGKWRTRETSYLRLLQLDRVLQQWDTKLALDDPNRGDLTKLQARLRDLIEQNEAYLLAPAALDQLANDVTNFKPAGVTVARGFAIRVAPRVIIARLNAADAAVTVLSLALAVVTAFAALYVDKPFGALGDYLNAFLWGFGIDSGVRGVAAIMARTH